ncbi:helix-turn-helix domain-containing protein [Actinomadura geliboluensis]|uniref:Helix-turn-helix domain-containing protein n=1 Tax=Actinomadura geliboluensis TaxID=882440 RepID=A0A5S4H9P5_9ACTN|nr:helix-turn-helix transcriptional regulator [Actinomadura geliboluensis]TMR41464.1 helix-turn-helix domain-containing protein [Actinomadura geliboluensis]
MAGRSSPTVRRRRLSKELRQLRRDSGKTREQVAGFVGCSPVTITRIEGAQTAGTVPIVARMLEFYGVEGRRRDVLLTLCREARKRGWWHQYSGSIPEWFEVFVGLEEEANEILTYESEAVPGLLQTERYMRAMLLADIRVPREEEIDRQVSLRLKRQERMTSADAPKMWAVLNEAVVRRQVGGPETMREQLEHLTSISLLNHINVVVLPHSAGAHPSMDGPCNVLRFPEPADPDVVYIQYRRGSIYLEDATDVNAYVDLFDHLRSCALSPDASRALMGQVIEEMV